MATKTRGRTAARSDKANGADGATQANAVARPVPLRKSSERHRYEQIPVEACQLLERNPQYLTPRQMASLKVSIKRDGFVVPILVRPTGARRFEVVSGNHRFMAAQELGYETVPAVIARLEIQEAKRLAINLNLIHGEPQPEQLAPFLADLDDAVLAQIHMEDALRDSVLEFDELLAERLSKLEVPDKLNRDSNTSPIAQCRCPTCGKSHIASK